MMRFSRRGLLFTALVLIICFLAVNVMAAEKRENFKYVVSKKGKRYHKPDCSAAKRIKPDHLIGFQSARDALKAGYTPCKICKPSAHD
jgi:methylphosphotriester-DNA--protein-cysteine methyltransferase